MKTITKKVIRYSLALILFVSLASFLQDRIISNDEIPDKIQNYINTHFPTLEVVRAEIDFEGITKKYEIKLSDRTELEFNGRYQIIEIDGKSALPESVIPQKIRNYVSTNYPNNSIIGWDLGRRHQEVKLDNGIELEFTLKHKFIRIDD